MGPFSARRLKATQTRAIIWAQPEPEPAAVRESETQTGRLVPERVYRAWISPGWHAQMPPVCGRPRHVRCGRRSARSSVLQRSQPMPPGNRQDKLHGKALPLSGALQLPA
ncbi:hypothetical protein FIBSPDRAFT_928108 [Athelia psychrophila]|uniref:Uncharacterized protein n=1 Tax=Athelia psychrophila TaxID=1759441 RepID=A0A166QW24_9AGAM|nr:hypothetical protein FIBSPDRAFT_928108 [Fibularhizoctonia sp. CBS 109695]